MGSVRPTTPPLRRRVGHLPHLSLIGRDGGRVDDHAARAIPRPRARPPPMRAAAWLARLKVPIRLTAMGFSRRGPGRGGFPARDGLGPRRDAGTADRDADGPEIGGDMRDSPRDGAPDRSRRRRRNRPPTSRATASPASALRSKIAGTMPRAASARAVASPSPDAAPEMTATSPSNNAISASLGHSRLGIAPGAAQVQTGDQSPSATPSARLRARRARKLGRSTSSSAITRSASVMGRSSTKTDSLVKLHRAGEIILQHGAEDETDQERRQRVKSAKRRIVATTPRPTRIRSSVALFWPIYAAHQREEQDEGDQVFARDREDLGDIGNERQVQDQQDEIAG